MQKTRHLLLTLAENFKSDVEVLVWKCITKSVKAYPIKVFIFEVYQFLVKQPKCVNPHRKQSDMSISHGLSKLQICNEVIIRPGHLYILVISYEVLMKICNVKILSSSLHSLNGIIWMMCVWCPELKHLSLPTYLLTFF